MKGKVKLMRATQEVKINLQLKLEDKGKYNINTSIPFLDHMLSLFAKHGKFDLTIQAKGDTQIDIHHTNEDIGIALGDAFNKALGDKKGIARFGYSLVCMDEALVRCVIDISGRAYFKIKPQRLSSYIIKEYTYNKGKGSKLYSYNYFKQFLKAFTEHSKVTLHLDILEGEDFHHILEASFKALGLSFRRGIIREKGVQGLPTTKGKID